MNGVFISYRREDASGFARGLYQSLATHFGQDNIFMDVEGIELGLDFAEAIDKSVATCGVLLVLIGKDWASCTDENGVKRLADPNDWVRVEVATALKRDCRVIPVRIRGAAMPNASELPDDLKTLTRRQALELRHDRWDADVKTLIEALEKVLNLPPKQPPPIAPKKTKRDDDTTAITVKASRFTQKMLAYVGAFFVLLFAIGLFFYEEEQSPMGIIPIEPPTQTGGGYPEFDPRRSVVDTTLILEVQQLLSELGYQPGPIDGKLGGQTTRAIQAFQTDNGLVVNGQVNEELIDLLDEALDTRAPLSTPFQQAPPSTAINMTGNWIDDEGNRYTIVQQGNMMQYQAFNLYGVFVGGGEGRIVGRNVEYVFVSLDGSQGSGRGLLAPDGRRMEYTVVNLLSGEQDSGWIHKE